MNDIFISVILGIVEGITEFLPISSTGHLIIVNQFVDFTGDFAHMFDIVIQLGAILSVVVYFRKRLIPWGSGLDREGRRDVFEIWKKTAVAVVPALVIGGLLGKHIKHYLFNATTVSIALIAGGILLIYLEKRKSAGTIGTLSALTYKTAFLIGVIQCAAMVPGTSRSAATIIGAMFLGASRLVAAEFSFFLAIPTMCAATAYSLMKGGAAMTGHQALIIAVGFIVSFFTAWLVIAAFMRYITHRDFRPFGWYRIALGLAVLTYFLAVK